MTGETHTNVERLNYSKPPPGYEPHPWRTRDNRNQFAWAFTIGNHTVLETLEAQTEGQALAAGWTHYKAQHDPPGMTVWDEEGDWLVQVLDHPAVESPGNQVGPGLFYRLGDGARAAAWAWYDRRLALVKRLDETLVGKINAHQHGDNVWLAWSDEDCTAVERYLDGVST